jgi:hypothetical protein
VLVDKEGDVLFSERSFGAGATALGEVTHRFRLNALETSDKTK